ncbi:DEAD/DEAH box helicase [Sporanaerobacter acetigenes]|jgi:ATP-dependent RNA helicase DeaD|uniref:ATP-dependent RNA helicase CshA n=1 Tax=Sporanaerobacter acetigenes DSM 13106 TaxID=1123281 RepID=A0A1M5YLN0_9FIRM|nr:DEAD/DEAH box helicase [Sporanaerobacter acetigenes]SHI12922.1 ATP-dependent RNA helicase DeaD [Sporanaerobacter acetigenes DSM 13106]
MKKLKFEDMEFSQEIKKAVSDMGFEEASPIQSQAIPYILEGKDVIGQAQTGTGKTAAFGVPILEMCDEENRQLQAIVLCPTRELCIQVAEEISKLAKYKKNVYILPVYGGQPIERQIKALKKGVQIVIGTPGRVIDHLNRHTLKPGNINMVVLDEADEMFDMGFRDDIELILGKMPEDRQTVFFSATMPQEIMSFAKKFQKNPEIIKVVHKELTVPKVEQYYFELKPNMKTEILCRLIDIYNPKLSLVFCNTKRKVDELVLELQGRGYFADGLHGDLKQTQRDKVMSTFRSGNIDILVATDVAARGIDVDDVDIVFNYDIPQDEEYYVHRIGRTARAGREGTAFSFVVGRDIYKLKDIQKYTKTKIMRKDLPTLGDVEEKKIDILLDKIRHELDNEEISKYQNIIDTLLEEDYNSIDIASAILKMYMDENKKDGHEDLDLDAVNTGAEAGMVRLFVNIGRRENISPRHIVGAITGETSLPRKSIGKVDIYDKFTFVEVPKEYVKEVLAGLKNHKIKGKKINIEIANPRH